MPDRSFQSGPVDHARVDLTESHELDYWTTRFDCTPEQLIDALRCAGVNAAAVGRYFASARSAANNGVQHQAAPSRRHAPANR